MSSHLKAELATTCSTLGRFHKGEYIIDPECIESVKDLIRYLKRDDEFHEIRRYLGESKVLQNDLIHIVKSCPSDEPTLFDVTLRLLINLTTPTMLFYGEEMPAEKIGRNIYISLIGYAQGYKVAFCDVEFWNKVCGKLTDLFERDWTERSADDGIQIERILMLLRNVLQIPADVEAENQADNDITVHDKVLWALRQSQIIELLLFISSNSNEEQYYLNLLEIFSLILREQNPKILAQCDVKRSVAEKSKDIDELVKVREMEKKNHNKYFSSRNFNTTFVLKGVKSLSNNDIVCHKPLEKLSSLSAMNQNKKQMRVRRNKVPVESQRVERRSTLSIRLFLKEFCLEFINSAFNHFMSVVKSRLDSGKTLAHDQTYYFWALSFFLSFATTANVEVDIIKDFLSVDSFHYVQTSMDNAMEHLLAEKKKTAEWVKRIHTILKAYHSLLETLFWMDCSKNPLTRSISRQIKQDIFYVVEYREMTLHLLLKYDSTKFSISYLKDLIETTHLFLKLLEDYATQTKLVVQKVMRKKSKKKTRKENMVVKETKEETWERIKDDVYDILCCENLFPEIPPFDAALDIPIDDQKGSAMKKIQKMLLQNEIKNAIGLLRSARQVWPENDHFGFEGMTVEDETMALQEICLADLGQIEEENKQPEKSELEESEDNEGESEEEEEEDEVEVIEQDFDMVDYKKRLVNKKIVEGCGTLLKNYKQNSDHTNHCVIKLLHRIGWECCMPAMLYQASLFWTLLKIMNDKAKDYTEINTFAVNLLRKFRKHAVQNPVVFLELLFWKENNVALEIQHGYQPYEDKEKVKKRSKKSKSKKEEVVDDEEHTEGVKVKKSRGRKKKSDVVEESVEGDATINRKKKSQKGKTKRGMTTSNMVLDGSDDEGSLEDNTNRTEVESDLSEDEDRTKARSPESLLDSDDENTDRMSGKEKANSSKTILDESDDEDNVRTTESGPRKNTKSSRILTSDDEDEMEKKKEVDILLGTLRSDGGYRMPVDFRTEQNSDLIQINNEKTALNSDEDENERSFQTSQENTGGAQSSENLTNLTMDMIGGSDLSNDGSRTSDASSNKRSRREMKGTNGVDENDTDESGSSKVKRPRFIDSDSDEGGPVVSKSRKRPVIIDSDSDGEPCLDDNDIINK